MTGPAGFSATVSAGLRLDRGAGRNSRCRWPDRQDSRIRLARKDLQEHLSHVVSNQCCGAAYPSPQLAMLHVRAAPWEPRWLRAEPLLQVPCHSRHDNCSLHGSSTQDYTGVKGAAGVCSQREADSMRNMRMLGVDDRGPPKSPPDPVTAPQCR